MERKPVSDFSKGIILGYYGCPTDEAVRNAIDEFCNGSTNLLFHVYYNIRQYDPHRHGNRNRNRRRAGFPLSG